MFCNTYSQITTITILRNKHIVSTIFLGGGKDTPTGVSYPIPSKLAEKKKKIILFVLNNEANKGCARCVSLNNYQIFKPNLEKLLKQIHVCLFLISVLVIIQGNKSCTTFFGFKV